MSPTANMPLVGVHWEESSITAHPALPLGNPTLHTNSTLQTQAAVTCWVGEGAPLAHVVRGWEEPSSPLAKQQRSTAQVPVLS